MTTFDRDKVLEELLSRDMIDIETIGTKTTIKSKQK
jgi:hypothetical protein